MQIDVRQQDGDAFIRAAGALDLSTAGELYRRLGEMRDDGVRSIRVDVSAVDFVDSPGLAVLLRWHDEAADRGDRFAIEGARGLVKRVLRETGTSRMLEA